MGALIALSVWMRLRGIGLSISRGAIWAVILLGVLFTVEFLFLYLALDWTSVGRASIIFYSMPVFVALVGHFLLPGERLTWVRVAGLILAMAGVIWVMSKPAARAASGVIWRRLWRRCAGPGSR